MSVTETLFESAVSESAVGLPEAFRRVYFHLYSNSDTSRAERLFEEIGKLLLVKLIAETNGFNKQVEAFLDGRVTANGGLMPELRARFPSMFDASDRFTTGDDALRLALGELAAVAITTAPASALGEAFQALIGPRLRGDKGQFFTPRELVKCMVQIANPGPDDKVVDPAAGTGGFLAEAHIHRTLRNPRRKKFGPLIGLEKDRDIQRLGCAILSVLTRGTGEIHLANSLDVDELPAAPFDADIVLTNPPFGAKIGIKETKILRNFELGHNWAFSASSEQWVRQRSTRQSQDPQILFLDLCLKLLKPGGLLGIVLPEGVFGNRKIGYVWEYVRSQADIETMIDCPRTTFQPGTDTKTNVVFIRKHRDAAQQAPTTTIRVAVAQHCGHDRRGRTRSSNGDPITNDYEAIRTDWARIDSPYWSHVTVDDPFYLVPRYYFGKKKNPAGRLAATWGGETATFGDLVDAGHLVVRKGHEVGAEAYGTGDIPFVRTSDIHNWEVSLNPTNGVAEEYFEKYAPLQHLKPHDILLIVDGRYRIGRTAILQEADTRCVVQSHCRIITVMKTCPVDAFELLYILGMREILEEMRNLVFIQSTLGSIGKRLSELAIPVPSRSGDWHERVDRFRNALVVRSHKLAELRDYDQPEPEL